MDYPRFPMKIDIHKIKFLVNTDFFPSITI